MRNTYIRIDTTRLERNAREAAALLKECALMAVVKADGYGHGLIPAAKAFLRGGAKALGVAIAEEGAQLRESGVTQEILVFGGVSERGARIAIRAGLTQTAHSIYAVRLIQEAAEAEGREAAVHIKIETGMHRLGVLPGGELAALLDAVAACPSIRVVGAYTHFADSSCDVPFTLEQNRRFARGIAQLRARLDGPLVFHAANSAAALKLPETRYDMARIGIALYGCHSCETNIELLPAMSWYTRIVQLHSVSAGESVGYGRTFTATRQTRVATIPVGYGDGYARSIGNRGWALVGGRRAPVIGWVCMDQSMLDVSDIPSAQTGGQVVLLGVQGSQEISAENMGAWFDSIPYETLLKPTVRVPRMYE